MMRNLAQIFALISLAAAVGMGNVSAKTIAVTGKVTDQQGTALAGASVIAEGARQGTYTDQDGNYTISAREGQELVFTFPGYKTQTLKVPENGILNVTLAPEAEVMEECVGVAYGTQQAASYTGSASEIRIRGTISYDVSAPKSYNSYYPGKEEFSAIKENRFGAVSKSPLSTFSLDVDGASYSNVRRMLGGGQFPDPDAVRVEEFVNYFSYDYPEPAGTDPVRITCEVGVCPWNAAHKLVSIGIKAKEIPTEGIPRSNFVFLIDVSGSMYGRLDMVKSSMKLLVNNLRDDDRVAIVTYANGTGVKLPSTPGSDKQKIKDALDELTARGSTAGAAGIQLAYQTARKNFIEGGNNRIILCTDGDFNVGASSPAELKKLIEKERKSGVFLTVLGYGMGNYKDNRMQTLAEKGNGNYAYIDNMQEANKVLVNEFGSTMYAVAKDVKLQVEFNPAAVQSYRLVGYESRLLNDEDFNDDTVDAGELGAGHTVTALYEIVPVGVKGAPGTTDPLKYGETTKKDKEAAAAGELMTVKLRYKEPDGTQSKKVETVIPDSAAKSCSENFKFAAAAAMFAQILRDSDFKGDASYDTVVRYARAGAGEDPNGYRRELIRLAETAAGLDERHE